MKPMSLLLTSFTDDPLATAAERFPQAWPRFGQPASGEPASPVSIRPFGLRFAVEPAAPATALPTCRYCPARQIAIGADGEPWYRQLIDMTMSTTGPSPDGTGSTGNEEWTPDYMPDEPTERV